MAKSSPIFGELFCVLGAIAMPGSVLIIELISQQQRDTLALEYGPDVITAALQNLQAVELLRDAECRQLTRQYANWIPPTREEILRELHVGQLDRDMRQRSKGRLGSET